jgi:putative ABC transport system substrate-binding protein
VKSGHGAEAVQTSKVTLCGIGQIEMPQCGSPLPPRRAILFDMRRRELITLLGVALAWPLAARAQKPVRIPRLGVLLFSTPQAERGMEPVRRTLRGLGYVDGRNLAIEYRFAEGKPERLPDLAAALVAAKPDVLLALGGDVTPAVVSATQTIPIVFSSSADPVQLGFVASLARPGRNATGVTFLLDELASKRLDILKQIAPLISRVGFLSNPDHLDNERRQAERAAAALGIGLTPLEVRRAADFDSAFEMAMAVRIDALYVVSSRLTAQHLDRIVRFAAEHRLPLAGGWGDWAQQGGLLSYGPNIDDMIGRAVTYVDRILKGAKPAELAVQQPIEFALVINLKTAKALDLTVPPTLLATADEVIE